MESPLLDPRNEPVILPALEQTPLPHLRIYNGFGCSYCSVVSQAVDKMRSHYNIAHAPERRSRGGRKCSGSRVVREQLEREHFGDKPPWEAVKFQRFFGSGPGSSGFRINQPEEQPSDTSSIQTKTGTQRTERSNSVTNDVFETLDALELEHAQGESMFQHAPTKTQVSPWLERTQWPSFLNGVSIHGCARFAPFVTLGMLLQNCDLWEMGVRIRSSRRSLRSDRYSVATPVKTGAARIGEDNGDKRA